jgi:hypothetical protein
MIKSITSLLLCVCLIASTSADDFANRAHTPPGSPFRALSDETLSAYRTDIEYEGRATISTKYRFVYDEESGGDQNPSLYFDPNPESQSQLPYVTRWIYESDANPTKVKWTEPAKEIWVTNVAEAAVALLGTQLAEEVLAGKHEKVSGEAEVVIEGFGAGYLCDAPFFSTRFVEVKREISAASVPASRGVTGC